MDPTFDARHITLNYTLPTTDDIYTITFGLLDQQSRKIVNYSIVHGAAITASLTMLVLLFLIIKNKKTPIFILNQIILVASILRSGLFLGYQLGPLGSLTTNFTGLVAYNDRNAYQVSIAGNAAVIILIALIQLSFTYQIWIIFQSPEVRLYGYMAGSISFCLMATTFGLYVNNAIYSTTLYESTYSTPKAFQTGWINGVPQIMFSASVNFMSLILILKLFFAIKTRRYLGLKQFSYYHILIIMFSQTLLIPTILTILCYSPLNELYLYGDIFTHISVALTALLLPFTSIWSTLANNSRNFTSSSLVYLTSSQTTGNASHYSNPSATSSPIDEKTLHSDNYSFFPDKLLKLKSTTSYETNSKNTLNNDLDSPLPNDILEILKSDEEILETNSLERHLSTVSKETIDKLDSEIMVKAVYNHKY